MEDIGCQRHGEHLPEPGLFCVRCERTIKPGQDYLDFDGDPWCEACLRAWEEGRRKRCDG